MKNSEFNFNISLSVLNHLGRNLYRNLITIIGEAISNAWDADANNVWITVDKKNKSMRILDDGYGMDEDDFQNKFLKIGYTKRKNKTYLSKKGRPFIGRKGIGKLALLSCSDRIEIITKSLHGNTIGGIIDNSELDKAITDDVSNYTLESINNDQIEFNGRQGTLIIFHNLNINVINNIDTLEKLIALYFRFSIIDQSFNIYLNEKKITEDTLDFLGKETQFVWTINDFKDDFIEKIHHNLEEENNFLSKLPIRGYFATVKKPTQLKIRGTNEKATVDLFVNGRLREKDILKHFPTSRIVENYVYGQIHCDFLDDGDKPDIFTSSREGVIVDNPEFEKVLKEVEELFRKLINEWDIWRTQNGEDGDPENERIKKTDRKASELYNEMLKEFKSENKKGASRSFVNKWSKEMAKNAEYNISSYAECFVMENLLRNYIRYKEKTEKLHLSERIRKKTRGNSEYFQNIERESKEKANISYEIRQNADWLTYLGMDDLARISDSVTSDQLTQTINRTALKYKPIRDAVGHTALLTENAKKDLEVESENIKSRLKVLLEELNNNE